MTPSRCLLCLTALLASACSDGGDTGATATVVVVDGTAAVDAATTTATVAVEPTTLHYPSGRVQASGDLIAGTTRRTGVWTTYFDDESGQRQWEGTYRDGEIDRNEPWREWNRDGSVRFDSTDQ